VRERCQQRETLAQVAEREDRCARQQLHHQPGADQHQAQVCAAARHELARAHPREPLAGPARRREQPSGQRAGEAACRIQQQIDVGGDARGQEHLHAFEREAQRGAVRGGGDQREHRQPPPQRDEHAHAKRKVDERVQPQVRGRRVARPRLQQIALDVGRRHAPALEGLQAGEGDDRCVS